MSTRTKTERFSETLLAFLAARDRRRQAAFDGGALNELDAEEAEDRALAALEDAFNDAVDERVQQALDREHAR